MSPKEKYDVFCQKTYVPIYSQPWWLDAVCGPQNWNVWLYENENDTLAAMPYYLEKRGEYEYITKALLTQNNGIIFRYPAGMKNIAKEKFEETIINAACEYIKSLGIAVYEQQYQYSFQNCLPFLWNQYTAIPRYTYVIEGTGDMEALWNKLSSNYRKNIKKGLRNATVKRNLDYNTFYKEHEKVFLRQNLPCPFSREKWKEIFSAAQANHAGEILYAETPNGKIASVLFLVWDERSVYLLLGGNIPGMQQLETYDALIWEGIKLASEKQLKFDFEGSVIKRIAKSYREFGGTPMLYFRIRKVFDKAIIEKEYQESVKKLISES